MGDRIGLLTFAFAAAFLSIGGATSPPAHAAQPPSKPASPSAPAAQKPPASQTATAAAPAGSPSVTALTDNGWPRDIMIGTTRITIFQPQIDTWDGFKITGRSAVAVTEKPDAPPLYGIIHISADAHIDKDEGMVSLEKIIIKTAAFPAVDPEKGRRWAMDVQARATTMRPMALERYAGKDGNVYKRGDDGGWDTVSRPEPREKDRTPQVDRSNL